MTFLIPAARLRPVLFNHPQRIGAAVRLQDSKAGLLQVAGFDIARRILIVDIQYDLRGCVHGETCEPVVLLDVQLPDIIGYEVCKRIREKWPSIMILMTSATFTSSVDRTVGLDSGADSFLVQPAESLELVAAIKALLRIRRSEEELRRLNETLEQRVQDRNADLAMANEELKNEAAQREKAESALVQAEKMQAVGQLKLVLIGQRCARGAPTASNIEGTTNRDRVGLRIRFT